MTLTVLHGDCRDVLPTLPERSVQCVVTSPPYYGLRKYSDDPREIGQEAQPDCLAWARREPTCGACYVCALRSVFAAVWRVLRDDGTVWLNLGDSYLQDKNLAGIPWRVALALQADGWTLRSDIVWDKPNPMPESVTDRPTRAHEYVFLLSKQARYYYDAEAIAEPAVKGDAGAGARNYRIGTDGDARKYEGQTDKDRTSRNRRSVWRITPQPYNGAHFATMPPALIEPCILAGSRPGDPVLDPFGGSGTVGRVAIAHGRSAILIELNAAYLPLIEQRTDGVQLVMEV